MKLSNQLSKYKITTWFRMNLEWLDKHSTSYIILYISYIVILCEETKLLSEQSNSLQFSLILNF